MSPEHVVPTYLPLRTSPSRTTCSSPFLARATPPEEHAARTNNTSAELITVHSRDRKFNNREPILYTRIRTLTFRASRRRGYYVAYLLTHTLYIKKQKTRMSLLFFANLGM